MSSATAVQRCVLKVHPCRNLQRSWQFCPQLRDLLRVAGGVGGDATAEAVDGRAKAMQLSVVDNEESVVEVGHQRELKRVGKRLRPTRNEPPMYPPGKIFALSCLFFTTY